VGQCSATLHADVLSIKSETSFGECVGYCRTTLVITSKKVTLTEFSWDKSQPARSASRGTSVAEWLRLSKGAPLRAIFKLPSVIGDPDSADGGAETLEINTGTLDKKSTFDYGARILGIDAYLEIIRKIRQQMDARLR
jgi:hypothetical protein